MIKSLFVMTHLGSGWEKLVDILSKDSRFCIFQTENSYKHPDDIKSLTSKTHHNNTSAAIWVDLIFHNKDFAMKNLCKYYNFIFWTSNLEFCTNQLAKNSKFKNEIEISNYWSYRMSGLIEYHKRCPKSLWNPDLKQEGMSASIFR